MMAAGWQKARQRRPFYQAEGCVKRGKRSRAKTQLLKGWLMRYQVLLESRLEVRTFSWWTEEQLPACNARQTTRCWECSHTEG